MKPWSSLLVVGFAAALNGCVGTQSNWDCPAPTAFGCASIGESDGTSAASQPGAVEVRQLAATGDQSDVDKLQQFLGARRRKEDVSGIVSEVLRERRPELHCPEGDAGPCRTAEVIGAVYVFGYEDADGHWHAGEYVYVVIEPPRWVE